MDLFFKKLGLCLIQFLHLCFGLLCVHRVPWAALSMAYMLKNKYLYSQGRMSFVVFFQDFYIWCLDEGLPCNL